MKRIIFCFFLSIICVFSQEYYRSNYNGLMLLKIDKSKLKDYKYYLKVEKNPQGIIERKILFENDNVYKRWDYTIIDGKIREEYYYVNNSLTEKSEFNDQGFKVRLIEYKNGEKIRINDYSYNKFGLVSDEIIEDYILKKTTKLKYIYDLNYQIKQIIKQFDDGTIIYWDVIFTNKGIVSKEYYSKKNERFVFYYNKSGQEFKGEIYDLSDNRETIKKKWDIYYTKSGKLFKRDEKDIVNNTQKIIYYDSKARDIKTEYFEKNELVKVNEKIYDKEDNLVVDRNFVGINVEETKYYYKEKKIVKTEIFKNGILKVSETILDDGKKIEKIFSEQGYIVNREYNEKGDFVKEYILYQ